MVDLAPRLRATRDLLLPGLRSYNTSNLEFDLLLNLETEILIVRGFNTANYKNFYFLITKEEIVDDSFKVKFRPQIKELIEKLEQS